MSRNKIRIKKREERRANESLKKRVALVTSSDFSKSFKAVKHSFFQVKTIKPKTDIEKILYVSDSDLDNALKTLLNCDNTDECKSHKNYIELDERFINKTFEKITH